MCLNKKDLIILAGNVSLNGIYNCYIDKTELISSYSLIFKPGENFFKEFDIFYCF